MPNMAAQIADGTNVWVVVPASPPLRLTIRACLDDNCRECGLPVYRCEFRRRADDVSLCRQSPAAELILAGGQPGPKRRGPG